MFILPAIAFVGGLVAMGRTKPQTNVRKLLCFGPRTGIIYAVEDMPEIGVVVVRAPGNRAIAQFQRRSVREPGQPGLLYQHGQGDPKLLELIRADFGVPPQKPAVVPSAAPAITEAEKRYYRETLTYRAPEVMSEADKGIVARAQAFEAVHGPIPHPNAKAPAAAAPQAVKAPASKPTNAGRSTP